MTLKETLKQLESLGNEKARAHNTKNGAGDNQFGVRLGDLRVLAKKLLHFTARPDLDQGNGEPALVAASDA
jgi:hypothetical protein